MSERYVHTVIGNININDEVEGYKTEAKAPVLCDDGTYITSYLSFVIVNKNGTDEYYSPEVRQSCMKPDQKYIIPIVIKLINNNEHKITESIEITGPFGKSFVDLTDPNVKVTVKEYIPFIKTKDCAVCTNCGRC